MNNLLSVKSDTKLTHWRRRLKPSQRKRRQRTTPRGAARDTVWYCGFLWGCHQIYPGSDRLIRLDL